MCDTTYLGWLCSIRVDDDMDELVIMKHLQRDQIIRRLGLHGIVHSSVAKVIALRWTIPPGDSESASSSPGWDSLQEWHSHSYKIEIQVSNSVMRAQSCSLDLKLADVVVDDVQWIRSLSANALRVRDLSSSTLTCRYSSRMKNTTI
jgi:hypothetical protein